MILVKLYIQLYRCPQ